MLAGRLRKKRKGVIRHCLYLWVVPALDPSTPIHAGLFTMQLIKRRMKVRPGGDCALAASSGEM